MIHRQGRGGAYPGGVSPHVETLVHSFAKKDKRERLLFLAERPSRWAEFCDAFLHDARSLDAAVMSAIATRDAEVESVVRGLGGTPRSLSFAISTIAEIDDRELPLGEALRAAIGRQRDTIILCIDTRRAFYENHEGEQWLLGRE